MKKVLSFVLAAVMVLGLVNIGLAEDPVTVTFWNGWTGSDGDVLIEMVDEFNRTNPYNIHVEMDINADFQTKIAASFAADEGPTMILGAHSYKDTYPDYLLDMNEVFEKTSLKSEDFVQGYLDLCSKNGILYVVPFQVTGRYMYWNKDLFEAAGLDPNTPPKNYDEWVEMAEKISNPDMNVYGSGVSYNAIYTNLQVIQRMGGLFVVHDDEGKLVPTFAGKDGVNPGYDKFLNWFKGMTDKEINPIEADTTSMFQAGQIGIMPDGAWASAGADNAGINYGVAQLPYGDAGPMNPCSVSGFSITKYATEEQKMAAMRFVEWWHNGFEDTETTACLTWSLRCGFPGYYMPAINDARYQASEKLAMMTCTDNEASTTYMAPDDFVFTFQLASEVIEVMVEDVIIGGMDTEAALLKAEQGAEALLK